MMTGFFISFFFHFIWTIYVSKNNHLLLLEVSDASKKVGKSCAEKRKAEKIENNLKHSTDTVNERGLSTDHMLQMEMIHVEKKKEDDCAQEIILVGLSILENALSRQIESAKNRAICLCGDDKSQRNFVY